MDIQMRLIPASLAGPDGLHAFLIELGRGESGFGGTDYSPATETLVAFQQRLVDRHSGRNLPPGLVASTTFWFLDDDSSIAGMSRLRHELNESLLHHGGHIGYYVRPDSRGKGYGTSILALTLAEGRQIGIQRFLLTVDAANVASISVIERNGGVMEDERRDHDTGRPFRRYWIS